MTALAPEYLEILKTVLARRFVPHLPPLLDTQKPAADQEKKQLSRAFSAFVLTKLLDLPAQVAAASVVDDFNDNGIDAIHYDEQSKTLYLLQTKLKATEQFKQDDAQAFCEGVRLLLKQDFSTFNENVLRRKTEIESALDSCSYIQFVVPFTGDGISAAASNALNALLNDESLDEERLVKHAKFYTAPDIVTDLLAEQAHQPVHTEIFLQKSRKVESPRTSYHGLIRLTDLVALHQEHDKALYERNIRYFLGSNKSDINTAIKNTLHETPGDFFYLNNGVTAICDDIEPKSAINDAKKLKVRALSIINGAQTIAAAAEFSSQNPDKSIDDAKVMFTLIKAPSAGTFGKFVTKARNHQNPVQAINFASLDENQERLRQEIAHLGFNYQYRPEATVTGSGAIITIEETVRSLALLQNDPRYVVWLKSEPARLAIPDSTEYKALFTANLSGVALINAVLYQREIRSFVMSYENSTPVHSLERLIYRHGVYAIAAVMMKRLRARILATSVVDETKISALIGRPLDQLRQNIVDLAIDPASQRSKLQEGPLAHFKKLESAIPFINELMKKNFELPYFQTTTDPVKLHQLAAEKKDLAHDLAERLSQAAPQL